MGGRIRNFTQETYDTFSRGIRNEFEENNVLLEEIKGTFITADISTNINMIKMHNSITQLSCNAAQSCLDKVFADVYEVEGRYATKFDEIIQRIDEKTKALKALTESLGQITDPSISASDFRVDCRTHIAKSLGVEYWEYLESKPLNQLTDKEYKLVAEKVEEIMQKPASEITDIEYRCIADRLVKIAESGDTKEIETILSWCYDNEQFMGEQAFADDDSIPYLQTSIIVNQNGKMIKIMEALDSMRMLVYKSGDIRNEIGKNTFGMTKDETLGYEKNILQMSQMLEGLINTPQDKVLIGNSLYLSCTETETGDRVFNRNQLFKVAYLKDEEGLHHLVDRYLDNGDEINDRDLTVLFNNQIRYSDGLDMYHNQCMIVEYPKNGPVSEKQAQHLSAIRLKEGLIETPEEIVEDTIKNKFIGVGKNTVTTALEFSKTGSIVTSVVVDGAIAGKKIIASSQKEQLYDEEINTILDAEMISQLNLMSSRLVYSMDGFDKTDECFTLYAVSTTPYNLSLLKKGFIEYGVKEAEVNALSVQGILDSSKEYLRIRDVAETNGFVGIEKYVDSDIENEKLREENIEANEKAQKNAEENRKLKEELKKFKSSGVISNELIDND